MPSTRCTSWLQRTCWLHSRYLLSTVLPDRRLLLQVKQADQHDWRMHLRIIPTSDYRTSCSCHHSRSWRRQKQQRRRERQRHKKPEWLVTSRRQHHPLFSPWSRSSPAYSIPSNMLVKVSLLIFVWRHWFRHRRNTDAKQVSVPLAAANSAECAGQAHYSCAGTYSNGPVHVLLNNATSLMGIWTPSSTWFLGPTWVSPPNGISIDSAVFAQLTRVPNTETDKAHATYGICSNGPYLRIACKRCCLKMHVPHIRRLTVT